MTYDDVTRERHWTCARRLRERRRTLALTQVDIVDRLRRRGAQTTNRALSSMENGRGLDLGLLPDLAGALDCSVTYLLGLTEDPHAWLPDEPIRAERAAQPDTQPDAHSDTQLDGQPAARPEPQPAASAVSNGSAGSWILGPDVPDTRPALGLVHRHDALP